MKTQEEILDRITAKTNDADDFFGFAREVLIMALDFDHASARDLVAAGVTADEWPKTTDETLTTGAAEYLEFAIGKIVGHRGISASRSVAKLTEFAWLLGHDDVVTAMGEADYAQYGAPQVKAFADGMGLPWPVEAHPELARMAQGLHCDPEGCLSGCGGR
jgi:hypothetical protein